MKQYYSTQKIAEIYDVSTEWLRRRLDATFVQDEHYIQAENGGVIRWDFEALERWWRGDRVSNKIDHHDAIIEKMLK